MEKVSGPNKAWVSLGHKIWADSRRRPLKMDAEHFWVRGAVLKTD